MLAPLLGAGALGGCLLAYALAHATGSRSSPVAPIDFARSAMVGALTALWVTALCSSAVFIALWLVGARPRRAEVGNLVACAGLLPVAVTPGALALLLLALFRTGNPADLVGILAAAALAAGWWAGLVAIGAEEWLGATRMRSFAAALPLALAAAALCVGAVAAWESVVAPGANPWLVRGGYEKDW